MEIGKLDGLVGVAGDFSNGFRIFASFFFSFFATLGIQIHADVLQLRDQWCLNI